MALVRQRTQLKNRLHATLAKYGLRRRGGGGSLRGPWARLAAATLRVAPAPHRLCHSATPRAGEESKPPGDRIRAADQECVQADSCSPPCRGWGSRWLL